MPISKDKWRLYCYHDFQAILNKLASEVEELKLADRENFLSHPRAKLFRRILQTITVEIPANPDAAVYRQGNTLGAGNANWRRAKLYERLRLFFRFSSKDGVIVYAWMNDEHTLRNRGAKSDVYAVFAAKLRRNDPPTDWDELLKKSKPLK